MWQSFSLTAPAVLLLCITGLSVVIIFRKNSKVPLPPGPPKIPILGNVLMLPAQGQEFTFAEWGRRYGIFLCLLRFYLPRAHARYQGDVIYAKVFRRTTIIVNTFHAAHDLMDKRSGNYSDRPPFVLLGM